MRPKQMALAWALMGYAFLGANGVPKGQGFTQISYILSCTLKIG